MGHVPIVIQKVETGHSLCHNTKLLPVTDRLLRAWSNYGQKDLVAFQLRKGQVMAKCYNDAAGMRGCRSRNENGQLRDKRDDTHIGTIEKQYGIDLGVRDDMHLGTYLEEHNIKSLNDLITGS